MSLYAFLHFWMILKGREPRTEPWEHRHVREQDLKCSDSDPQKEVLSIPGVHMYTNTNKTQRPKFHGRFLSFLRRHTLVVSILFQSLKKKIFGLQPSKPVVLKWE